MEVDGEQPCCVEVTLEDGESCPVSLVNYSEVSLSASELVETFVANQSDHTKNMEVVVKPPRRRSLIWSIFKQLDSPGSASCQICEKKLSGGISNLRRHLSTRHPEVLSDLLSSGQQPPADLSEISHSDELTEEAFLDKEQLQSSVEEDVLPEEDNSEVKAQSNETAHPPVSSTKYVSLRNPAQQPANPEKQPRRKSLIWQYFNRLSSLNAANCRFCMTRLQCPEGGGTSNLHRHLSKRHPKAFSELTSHRRSSSNLNVKKNSNAHTRIKKTLLEIQEGAPLEDSDSNSGVTLNESGDSIINGTTDTLEEQSSQQTPHSDDLSDKQPLEHNLIWNYFEQLQSLNAVRCRVCTKKMQYSDSRNTGNLQKHLAKRHPNLIPEAVPASMDKPNVSKLSQHEKRLFSRERELIEALRRTQKEEAQTLEHQRELLERLRAVSAREAEAEKKEIELLRKAQQEEAKDLKRQQEELENEKADLQKKWEELQLNKDKFLLLSENQEAP